MGYAATVHWHGWNSQTIFDQNKEVTENNGIQYFHVSNSSIGKIKLYILNDMYMDGETMKKNKPLTQV